MRARAKAWARAAYVCRGEGCRQWLRWARTAFSTSPRYLVYRAASELLFAVEPNASTADQIATIVAQLPLASFKADQLSWRDAAKLVAHNFHMFVESTRC
jgi:hypothetical protein